MTESSFDIKGSVIPLPTPFKPDGSIDPEQMEKYVDFLSKSNIPAVMTTVGTSRYNLLSRDEVMLVNEAVKSGASGDTKVILANPPVGHLEDALEVARHTRGIGGDYYLVYYPERYYGDEYIVEFFESVAREADIPVLIHEMPMRYGLGGGTVQYSIELLQKLLEIPNVIGFKEEALDPEYSNKVVEAFADSAVIIGAGGGMSRYLERDYQRGARAFLGGIGNFIPELENEFYQSITTNNPDRAREIVQQIEKPYFKEVVPMGWHPSLKAVLALRGHMDPTERKPMKQISGEELDRLEQVLKKYGWA